MYYYIREVYAKDPKKVAHHSEGYCKHLKFQSELIDGIVHIDGCYTYDIGVGDEFIVDSKPEYRLKCIRFLI
jgi:hypothetical protein